MNLRRFIVTLYVLVFIGISATSGVFLWEARQEYRRLKEIEAASRRRLAETEARLEEQQRILERLRNDPAYVEKVIRQQMHYARPDEYIFRFGD